MAIPLDQRMRAPELRKLLAQLPITLMAMGFAPAPGETGAWERASRFGCPLRVTPYIKEPDGALSHWPWLACRFDRPTPPGWALGGPGTYADIRAALGEVVNQYSGKYNCHVQERLSAADVMGRFVDHLERAI